MASINEIHQYINKYAILNKDINVYKQEITGDIEFELEDIYQGDKETILSYVSSALNMAQHAYGILYVNTEQDKNSYLCSYVALSTLSLLIDYYNIYAVQDSFLTDLSDQGQILLMTFACNRFQLIESCYPKIVESILNGNMGRSVPRGGDGEGNSVPPEPQRLGVLAIEMMASERKQTIDWASANIPVDPFYQRFCQEALYSKDEQELTYWLTKLCDNHLEWTSLFMDNAVKQPATGYEIDDKMLLLWPFEYHAVRNFRARHGLSTPGIDHPLLKTSMAMDHYPNFATWQKPEWFNELIDRVTEVNPELNFVKEWFN